MHRFERTITIDRPLAEVFAFATDPAHIGEWLGEVVEIQALQTGPLAVGSTFRETRRVRGKEVTSVIEIVRHRGPAHGPPPYEHAARTEMMGLRGEYAYRFSAAAGGGTRVDLVATMEARTLMARALAGVALREMEKEDGDQLERLSRALMRLAGPPQGS